MTDPHIPDDSWLQPTRDLPQSSVTQKRSQAMANTQIDRLIETLAGIAPPSMGWLPPTGPLPQAFVAQPRPSGLF